MTWFPTFGLMFPKWGVKNLANNFDPDFVKSIFWVKTLQSLSGDDKDD